MFHKICLLSFVLFACGGLGRPAATPMAPLDDGGAVNVGSGEDAGAALRPPMGATIADGGVHFSVWAPNATAARVQLSADPMGEPLVAAGDGTFSANVAEVQAGSRYRFQLETPSGSLTRLDPYCRQLTDDRKWCLVVDPKAFEWRTSGFSRPVRAASVVYELHVGSFSARAGARTGTFQDVRGRLSELADLGVNVIELMPVHAFGGNPNGWGYNPQLYWAPKETYGTPADLKALIDDAHASGIAVWTDFVVNHCDGWRQAPLACFDDSCPSGAWGVYFFPPGPYAATPWGPRPNYTEPFVTAMLLGSVQQWLEEFRGDGFRWDSVSNIRALDGRGTVPGGRELLVEANGIAHRRGALSVAEDLKGDDALTRPPQKGGFGFDAQWDGFGYDVANVLVPFADDGRDLRAVERLLKGGYAGDAFARLVWTENHDTVGNGGARFPARVDPAAPGSIAARRRSMLAATLMLTSPGVPMLFMGQESLALGGFTDPPAILPAPTEPGLKVRAFYKDLIALRRNLAGGAGGLQEPGVEILHRHDTNKVIAYRRHGDSGEDVIVVLNLRNKAYVRYDIGVPYGGAFRVRLDTAWKKYGDDLAGGQSEPFVALDTPRDGQPFTLPVRLGAYGALVLTR